MFRSCLCAAALLASAAWAQDKAMPGFDDLMHARNLGMGGAYRPLGFGVESIGGNPAALALYKRYQVEASGAWDPATGFGFGTVGVADSASSELAMGMTYHLVTLGDGETRRTAHINTAAFAINIANVFAIGLSGRNHNIVLHNETNSVTMNAGIVIRPWEWLSVSASAHNIIDNFNPDIQRYFVFGASSLLFGQLSPVVDVKLDFNDPTRARASVAGGVEWLIGNSVPIRAGYSFDGLRDVHAIAFGAGFFAEGSGVDVGYRHEVNGPGRMIAITVKYQVGAQ